MIDTLIVITAILVAGAWVSREGRRDRGRTLGTQAQRTYTCPEGHLISGPRQHMDATNELFCFECARWHFRDECVG